MLTVSLLVCAMMVLATADEVPTDSVDLVDPVDPVDPTDSSDPTEAPSPCPEDWSEHNGHCYMYNSNEMEWGAAEKHCQSQRANLASVHSVEEYEFIQKVVGENGGGNETWIGGSDCQQNNSWFWSNGKPFVFTLWCAGEPNNLGGDQSCLQMNHNDDKCWDDKECSTLLPSVCAFTF